MQSKLLIFLLSVLFISSAFCQIEKLKWQKADILYEKQNHYNKRNYSFESDNAGEFVTKSLANAYWFFISDVDGDNCPFHPTCSAFLIQSIKETNIFQASLIFLDRFTRDMNLVKSQNQYPRVRTGYFYDPPGNYMLVKERIIYLPPVFIVESE